MSIKQLKPYLKNLADEIRIWSRTTEKINAQEFPLWMSVLYTTGNDDGYQSGYTSGYDEGEEIGYTIGFNEGHDWGYDAGKQAEYDRFWDAYQANGKRGSYQYGFCSFNDETFKPKYDIRLSAGYTGTYAFYGGGVNNLAETLEKQGVVLDTSMSGYLQAMFYNFKTTRLPVIDCTHAADYNASAGMQYTFRNCSAETIDKLILTEKQKYSSTFTDCKNLKNIVIEGLIGNNIDFGQSPLSKDSITSIVNALSGTVTGQTLTLQKSAVNDAFSINVDDESTYPEGSEFYTLRHSKDNWTFSYV